MNKDNIKSLIPFIYIGTMQSTNSKRKKSDSSISSSSTTNDYSKKLLTSEKKPGETDTSIKSKSSDEVEVLPNLADRLSKLESELMEVKKELAEFKSYNNRTILEDDAIQMKSFWNKNRRGLEDFIATRIADCKTCVLNCTRDFSGRIKKLEKQIDAVWEKEEERTQRLDALIKNEKK